MSKAKQHNQPTKVAHPQSHTNRHSATQWYTIASIWFAVGIINFLLGYSSVGAIFAALGVLQLVIAIWQDIRERKK